MHCVCMLLQERRQAARAANSSMSAVSVREYYDKQDMYRQTDESLTEHSSL